MAKENADCSNQKQYNQIRVIKWVLNLSQTRKKKP